MKNPARILLLLCIAIIPLSTAGAAGRTESLSKLSMHRIEDSVTHQLGDQDTLSLGSIAADIIITKDAQAGYVSAFLTGYAYRTISLDSDMTGSMLSIHTDWNGETSINTKELTLEIHIPEDYTKDLFVQSSSGSIIIPAGDFENLEVSNVSGRTSANGIEAGSIYIRSVSGSIEAVSCDAEDITLKSSSGSITYTGTAGEALSCVSISGSIQAEGTASAISCMTTSGSFRMNIKDTFDTADISTISGSIEINLPEGLPVQGSIASVSGEQQIDLEGAAVSTGDQKTLFSRGSAPAVMSLASVSGRIRISDR